MSSVDPVVFTLYDSIKAWLWVVHVDSLYGHLFNASAAVSVLFTRLVTYRFKVFLYVALLEAALLISSPRR